MRKDFFNESFVLVSLGTLLETIFPGFRNFKFKRTKRAIGDRSFDIHFIMKARGSKYRENNCLGLGNSSSYILFV